MRSYQQIRHTYQPLSHLPRVTMRESEKGENEILERPRKISHKLGELLHYYTTILLHHFTTNNKDTARDLVAIYFC